MNRIHRLSLRGLSAAALLVGAASAATKEQFCSDLAPLEEHVVASSKAWNDSHNHTLSDSTSICSCVNDPNDERNENKFMVDCSLIDSYPVQPEPTVYFERVLFELKEGGEYSLMETSWGTNYNSFDQSHEISVTREEFYFEDGALAGCKANACTSCDICENKKSVAIDCSYVDAVFGETYGKVVKCDEDYERAYVNAFDFGVITGDGAALVAPPAVDAFSERDPETFCSNLSGLESHMNESFEKKMGKTFTSSYKCVCGELDDGMESFELDCGMEGADGHMTFLASEGMAFKLKGGRFELSETSWGFRDSLGEGEDEKESFALEDGAVASCEAKGCTSCSVCEDKKSVAVDCNNIDVGFYSHDCTDGYTGSFSHNFDFGVISLKDAPDNKAGVVAAASNNALASRKAGWMAALAFVATVLVF